MPFAYSEFFDLALHWQTGFVRRHLLRLPSDHFISKYREAGVPLNTVQKKDGQPAVCRICNFAIASLKLGDNWIFETCSNYSLKRLIDNSGIRSHRFEEWMRQLGQLPIKESKEAKLLTINVISFGYKSGPTPQANMLFDMRFLDNPYWVTELRPMTGLDKPVQNYVLEQTLAKQFLTSFLALIDIVLPTLKDRNNENFTIAFGCTGGQHRSVSFVEHVAKTLKEKLTEPDYIITISHRELPHLESPSENRAQLVTKEQQS